MIAAGMDRPFTRVHDRHAPPLFPSARPAPDYLMRDKNCPHAFTAAQMGHHDTQDPADHAGEA
jgi:hypothetical protein